MQYCVSGSASNLITLIYPDLQVLRDNTVILALRMHCRCAPHTAICMHWRCAPQPMRILSSWFVKEYCNAVLCIWICNKFKGIILIKVQFPENTPSKRPASKGLVTRQAEGRDEKTGIGRSGKKKARDNKRSAANCPVDESYFWHHYTNFMTRYG